VITRWAILGAGAISRDFARGLEASQHGALFAVGSSDPDRAREFARNFDAEVSGSYAEIIAHPDVDAVYVATMHPAHADLAIAALEAGKAVLCEKPLTHTPEQTARVLEVAAVSGRPFLEAYKYRFGPLGEQLRTVIESGEIGVPVRLEAAFGFEAAERTGRVFDPADAGGAILDVGGYPVSLAVGIATWAGLAPTASILSSDGLIGDTGVDEWATAEIDLGGFIASVRTSVVEDQSMTISLHGTLGTLEVLDMWGTRDTGAMRMTVTREGEPPHTIEVAAVNPFGAEADAVSLAIAEDRSELSQMTWAESTVTARLLADWRAELD
jgi:dihydrodiol dehydrogenase / D-xylose 1-dehydrogenase (NADP)